jgi:hypothetical protein
LPNPITTVAELLKTLKGSGLQLRACSITGDGGLSFEVIPDTIAPVLLGGKAKGEPDTFEEIPTPFDNPPKDPKKYQEWIQQGMREALGSGIPRDDL